jgi:hypothetical protein
MYELDTEICLFGFDWKIRIQAHYERPEPCVGLQGGFIIERLYLLALHDGDDWVEFMKPAEVAVPSCTHKEYDLLEKVIYAALDGEGEYA